MKPKVLLILSCARSGSTLLDILLSNHPDITSGGELAMMHVDRGYPENNICACGEYFTECPHWGPIFREWSGEGEVDVAAYTRLQMRYEYAWNASLATAFGAKRLLSEPGFEHYAAQTAKLMQVIQERSGKAVIVDSSKDQYRALAMAGSTQVQAVMVHLVRDPRAVAWSVEKTRRTLLQRGTAIPDRVRPVWRSATNWVTKNAQIQRTLEQGTGLTVRYEDLAADPAGELGRIGALIGEDLAEVGRRAAAGERLAVGHIMGGNHTRKDRDFRLRTDVDWRGNMPAGQRRLVWAMTGWMARGYGYH